MDILKWVENWYASHCDGDWEHQYGLKIGTLDNPGWDIEIDLADTGFEMANLGYQHFEKSDNDWWGYSIENNVFKASGDPFKLTFLLEQFRLEIINYNKGT